MSVSTLFYVVLLRSTITLEPDRGMRNLCFRCGTIKPLRYPEDWSVVLQHSAKNEHLSDRRGKRCYAKHKKNHTYIRNSSLMGSSRGVTRLYIEIMLLRPWDLWFRSQQGSSGELNAWKTNSSPSDFPDCIWSRKWLALGFDMVNRNTWWNTFQMKECLYT